MKTFSSVARLGNFSLRIGLLYEDVQAVMPEWAVFPAQSFLPHFVLEHSPHFLQEMQFLVDCHYCYLLNYWFGALYLIRLAQQRTSTCVCLRYICPELFIIAL